MKKPRPANPIIPGNSSDRTGAAGIIRQARAELNRRFAGLQAEVLAIFASIRTYEANEAPQIGVAPPAPARIIYALTPEELAQVAAQLQAALDRWILEGREAQHVAWWDRYQSQAAQLGSAQASANLAQPSASYAASRTLQQVVFSEPYRLRAATAAFKSYEHWTGLSGDARATLAQIIGRAVVDGKSPKAVRAEIMQALDVSKSRAQNYAQTEITDTLRQARAAEADAASEEYNIAIGLLWTSALKPTTRPHHAARSGKVYTTKEVRDFYAVNGNRFRCYCSTTECLLDTGGAPILTDTLKNKMAQELSVWKKAHAK